VNYKHIQHISLSTSLSITPIGFIDAYIARPCYLERISLFEVAQKWTYKSLQKFGKWKEHSINAVVRVSPHFTTIPIEQDGSYIDFCII